MKLHRYDFENQDGKMVRVRKDEIYAWVPVNTKTGEVDMDDVHQFDDELEELHGRWKWMRFALTLSPSAASKNSEIPIPQH